MKAVIKVKKTSAYVTNPGITYNEAGVTYNQAGLAYGGITGYQDRGPIITTTGIPYTAGTLQAQRGVPMGLLLAITHP